MTDEIRVPAYDELMQPLLDVLKADNRQISIKEIREKLAQYLNLSVLQTTIRSNPNSPGRRTRYEHNLSWTCVYLKSAGYITNPKYGTWMLTELGQQTNRLDTYRIKRDVQAQTYVAKNGVTVTVPNGQDELEDEPIETISAIEESVNAHTEIQWLLLKLAQDMGLKVWIASNDQGKQFDGNVFKSQPAFLKTLPTHYDDATQRTIELIDVLWFKGTSMKAAFEIENTSSIYSGLLRMSDLVAMQPDIDVPLYIVAPDERQRKVMSEINRPTFSRATDLVQRCRYISYTKLHQAVDRADGLASHLSPSFINQFSEGVASDT